MRFWNTHSLAEDLKANRVTEREQAHYLIGTLFLATLGEYGGLLAHSEPNFWLALDCAISLLAVFVGYRLCAAANREGDDKSFVVRALSLSWPLCIRFIVLGILVSLPLMIVEQMRSGGHADKSDTTWVDPLLTLLLSTLFVWRLRTWIRYVSGQVAAV